jgi:hypothetical protein
MKMSIMHQTSYANQKKDVHKSMSRWRGSGNILQRMMTSLCDLCGAIIEIRLQFNSYIVGVFSKSWNDSLIKQETNK